MDDIIKISKEDLAASRAIVLKEIGEEAKPPKELPKPPGFSLKSKVMGVINPSSIPSSSKPAKKEDRIDLLKALSKEFSVSRPAAPKADPVIKESADKPAPVLKEAERPSPQKLVRSKVYADITIPAPQTASTVQAGDESIDLEAIEKQLDAIKVEPVPEAKPKYRVKPFSARAKRSADGALAGAGPFFGGSNLPSRKRPVISGKGGNVRTKGRAEKPVPIRIVPDQDDRVFFAGVSMGFKVLAQGTFFFLLSYAAFCLCILIFDYDTPLARKLSRIIPVPAVVSEKAVINYYDYADYISGRPEGSKEEDALKDLAGMIATGELIKRYGLNEAEQTGMDIRDILNEKILFDEEINGPALTRAKKIKELSNSDDFAQAARQYGEEFRQATMTEVDAVKSFGKGVASLKPGEVSDIIASSQGFYIVKMIGRNESGYSLMSVFIKGLCLKDYLDQKAAEEHYWVLSDMIKSDIIKRD